MTSLKKFFRFSCLALALAFGAGGAAQATPAYHVSIDTGAYTGQALMDFTFLANLGATPASAVLDHFSGAFGAELMRSSGVAGAIPGPLTLGNGDGGSYLTQFITLGGKFGFDIGFEGAFATLPNLDGSTFNVTLYQPDFAGFIGVQGSVAAFDLLPPQNGRPGAIVLSAPNALASIGAIAQVPEPPVLALVLGALALMALARRRAR